MPKLHYCHNGLIKNHLDGPKWHFGQVRHRGKNTIWGVFFIGIPNQKNHDSCSECKHSK